MNSLLLALTLVAAPAEFMNGYAAEAGAGHRPSAERGRALYETERDSPEGRQSCRSCHTADPRAAGKTRAGKAIEPLAPVANAQRFTDKKKTEKWFRRNCSDVLSRECTPAEKADFIAYLLTVK